MLLEHSRSVGRNSEIRKFGDGEKHHELDLELERRPERVRAGAGVAEFGFGVLADDGPRLEAAAEWPEGAERRC